MISLYFSAPAFIDSDANGEEDGIYLDDAEGAADELATIQRFVRWLRDELIGQGIPLSEAFPDEEGWVLEASGDPGFVLLMIARRKPFTISVSTTEIGTAPAMCTQVDQGIERVIRSSPAITDIVANWA